jgi:adenylate cyclase
VRVGRLVVTTGAGGARRLSEIFVWIDANETVLSGIAAVVVVLSIVGAAVRGALKRTSAALVETARSTKEAPAQTQIPTVDVSQPVPGFGGRPAIAVLPFDNMSKDPEQDYFADGITEDILTSLQSFRTFPVIARNSTFAYKGKSMDLREVAKELGAGYILEGSVRKSGDKVRITGQLIDAEGRHIWADRYDRDLSDIFALQDEITTTIVGAIAPEIDSADMRRTHSKPTENMDAWDCVLRAHALSNQTSVDNLKQGHNLLEKAIELDPQFAEAHAMLGGFVFTDFARYGGTILDLTPVESMDKVAEHASKALYLDRSFPFAHGILGIAHAYRRNTELGLKETEEAVRLNPSGAQIRFLHAQTLAMSGNFEAALEQIEIVKRLSPGDPGFGRTVAHETIFLFAMGRYEDAEKSAAEAIAARPQHPLPRYTLLVILDALGRREEARTVYEEVSQLVPDFSPQYFFQQFNGQPEIVQKIRDALQRAGWEE